MIIDDFNNMSIEELRVINLIFNYDYVIEDGIIKEVKDGRDGKC